MKKSLLFLMLIGLMNTSYSQVVTANTNTVAWYVQNVLLGTGVTVSNITLNGVPATAINQQVGEFTDATSSIGLPNGVIVATGDIALADQPNTSGSSSLGGTGSSGSDPDLTAIVTPNPLFDEAILEFDFIPLGDTIMFNYVFASEEYEEYVCSAYNDVFGFFLTGNNPAGGVYASQNIALVPNPLIPGTFTTTAVSINTVNPGIAGINGIASNCAALDPNWASYNVFYQTNLTTNYEYDGRTTLLPVVAPVFCGQTYHIKIAISDVGDAVFDSGVFLEAGSFSSNGALNALTAVVPPNLTLCGQPYNVNFSAGPTPPPQSYWDFGDGIGTDTAANPAYTYADTGTYTVMYIAMDPSLCVNSDTAYFTVQIIQNDSLAAQFNIPPYDPCVDSLTITLAFTGSGADSLFWDMGDGTTFINDTSVTYTYTSQGTYIVTFEAYDTICGQTFIKTDTIDFNPVITTVNATPPTNIFLCSSPYDVNFTGNTPLPPQSYWDFGDGLGTDTAANPLYTYADTGSYNVMYVVIDSSTCNVTDTAYFNVTVAQNDSLDAQFLFPPYDPCVDSLTIQLDFTGSGADSLFWDMGNGSTFINDTSISYTYITPGTYVVSMEAYDLLCNNTFILSDTVFFNPVVTTVNATPPTNIFLCSSPYDVNFTGNTPTPANSYWDFGDGLGTDTAANPLYTYADTGSYNVMYVAIDSSTCNVADTAFFNVTVAQNDSLNAQFLFPPYDPCVDSLTIQLDFTGSGADSLFWNMGNGSTFINDTSVTYTYNTPGTYYVSLEAYDLLCNNTFTLVDTVFFNPVVTTVNATPPTNIFLCSSPYDVNFTGNTPTPANSYWDFGDGLGTDTAANPLYTYADTGSYNVMYVAIDSSTCNVADTAYFNVTVAQNDSLDAQFLFPPYDPCVDSLTIQLDFTGSGADSLFWDMGNGITFINDTSVTYTYNTPGTYYVSFEAYDLLCNNTFTLVDTLVFTPTVTTVNATPPSNLLMCSQPFNVNFTGNNPSPPNSYWDFGDGIGSSTQPNPMYTYADTGIFNVMYVAIDSSTCNIADTAYFNVQLVQAPPFSATIDFNPPPPCSTDSFFVELRFTGVGADSLAWDMGNGVQFINVDSVDYLYPDAGIYTISLFSHNNLCGDKSVQSNVTFIAPIESSGIIPNVFTPNNDGMNDKLVFAGVDKDAEFHLRIYNRWGRKIYETNDASDYWDGTIGSRVGDAGTYFYILTYTDVCSTEEKLVKGHITLLK